MPPGVALTSRGAFWDNPNESCVAAARELASRRAAGDIVHCSGILAKKPVVGPPVQTHVAAYPELIFVRQGLLEIVSPVGVVRISPGQLLVIDPGVEHGEVHRGNYDAVFFVLHNTNVYFYEMATGEREMSIYLLGGTDLRYITDAIRSELIDRFPEFEASVHGLLEHLACLLIRRIRRGSYLRMPWMGDPLSMDKRAWLAVQRSLAYLAGHLGDPIDAQDVAESVGYSPGYLNRLFGRFFGTSVTRCLRDLRLTRARDLLQNSNLPVAEIAERVGYSDPSNFRRAFVAMTGVPLKAFRSGNADWSPARQQSPGKTT